MAPRVLQISLYTMAGEMGCATIAVVLIAGALLIAFPLALGLAADLFPSASGVVADMFIDAALMALPDRRLKRASRQRCLSLAIWRTWILVLIVAITLSIAGAAMQVYRPHAKSIGDLSRQYGRSFDKLRMTSLRGVIEKAVPRTRRREIPEAFRWRLLARFGQWLRTSSFDSAMGRLHP